MSNLLMLFLLPTNYLALLLVRLKVWPSSSQYAGECSSFRSLHEKTRLLGGFLCFRLRCGLIWRRLVLRYLLEGGVKRFLRFVAAWRRMKRALVKIAPNTGSFQPFGVGRDSIAIQKGIPDGRYGLPVLIPPAHSPP